MAAFSATPFVRVEAFDVGKSCHDILATQGATQSGLYLIHPPNIIQGPWKVYCDQESDGGGWTVCLLLTFLKGAKKELQNN